MIDRQAAQCLQLAHTYFPSGPWPEDVENMWLVELRSFEFGDLMSALKQLHDSEPTTWCPPWATITSAALTLTRHRRENEREVEDRRALLAGPQADHLQFQHRWAEVMREGRDRVRNKPKRIVHDHSDKRICGFYVMRQWHTKKDGERVCVEAKEPAPMWHLTCPRCGSVEVPIDLWTPEGVRVAREMGRGSIMSEVPILGEQIGAF